MQSDVNSWRPAKRRHLSSGDRSSNTKPAHRGLLISNALRRARTQNGAEERSRDGGWPGITVSWGKPIGESDVSRLARSPSAAGSPPSAFATGDSRRQLFSRLVTAAVTVAKVTPSLSQVPQRIPSTG